MHAHEERRICNDILQSQLEVRSQLVGDWKQEISNIQTVWNTSERARGSSVTSVGSRSTDRSLLQEGVGRALIFVTTLSRMSSPKVLGESLSQRARGHVSK